MYISAACRYMGLGSEWNDRWCVVMPRFPSVAAPANQQLTRSLLVIYKVYIHVHFACLQVRICMPAMAFVFSMFAMVSMSSKSHVFSCIYK